MGQSSLAFQTIYHTYGPFRRNMTFKNYVKKSAKTAIYPRLSEYPIVGVMYAGLGLAGEAGEVAEQIKKGFRNDLNITPERKENIEDELGDVLWYTAAVVRELNLDLDKIAEKNIDKLTKRQAESNLKHE